MTAAELEPKVGDAVPDEELPRGPEVRSGTIDEPESGVDDGGKEEEDQDA